MRHEPAGEITKLLQRASEGEDRESEERLLGLTYAKLRAAAGQMMRHERPGHTLQPTALVHELCASIMLWRDWPKFSDRKHFFAFAMGVMRRILIDHARKRLSTKRGNSSRHDDLDLNTLSAADRQIDDILTVNEALDKLKARHPRQARVVELQCFLGLTTLETAALLEISPRSVERDWHSARNWLSQYLQRERSSSESPSLINNPASNQQLIGERYRIRQKLGEGGFSTVYLVKDEYLQRDVVLKLFSNPHQQPKITRVLAKQELRALCQLRHASITTVLDAGETSDGLPYMVMQYVPGGRSLRTTIDPTGMPLERVVQILIQICDALASAHDAGVLHLDLKPENILLIGESSPSHDDRVMLIDFGSAWITNLPRLQLTAGTPSYMAPEMLQGELSRKSDIFALGVIAFEMITGSLPSAQSRPADVAQTLSDLVPLNLANVIARAMALDPTCRFDTVREVQAAIITTATTPFTEPTNLLHPNL